MKLKLSDLDPYHRGQDTTSRTNRADRLFLIQSIFYNSDFRENPLKYILNWDMHAGKMQNEMTNLSWNYVVNMTDDNLTICQ